MEVVLRVGIGWLLAVLVPGLAITLAILPSSRRRPLELLALAPLIGVAATFAVAEVVSVLGVPFAPWVTVALIAVGATVAGVRWRSGAQPAAGDEGAGPVGTSVDPGRGSGATLLVSLGLLAIGIAIGAGMWASGIKDSSALPPNRDGGHHGFYVARISAEQTVDVHEVVISDPVTQEHYGYYPLGLHASAALGHRIGGATIGDTLTGWVILFAAFVYPLGMFVLTRRLAPDRPLLPGFVALACPLFAMFPYKWILWGGLAQLISLTVVPIAVVCVLDAARRVRGSAVLAGVAVFGVATIHLSQALLVAFVAAILLGADWVRTWNRTHDRAEIGAQLRALAIAAGVTALLILPTLVSAIGGASDRQGITEPNNFLVPDAVGGILTGSVFAPPQGTLYLVVFIGFAIAMYQRRYVAWTIAGALVFLIFFASATPGLDAIRSLSSPWYSSPDRTSGMTVPFVTVFAGVALEAATVWLVVQADRTIRSRRALRGPATGVVSAVVAVVFVAGTFTQARAGGATTVRRAFAENPTQDGDLQAMAALRRIDRDGSTVVNQEQDGSIWMYAAEGLRPLFTQALPATGSLSRSTQNRVWLVKHLGALGHDPRVEVLLERYHARFVYLNTRTYLSGPPWIQLDALRANPRYREIVTGGTSHVFAIIP